MSTLSTPVHNTAAWALRPKTRPLVVSPAPYRPPSAGYVAIKVYCVAINPIDWIMQDTDIFSAHYPTVFGSDLAGEVVEVGNGVEGLRVGDRVIAHAHNLLPTDHPPHGAFQQYVLVPSISISAIPQSIPFQSAVVLPLSISTASAGLFQQHYLSLPIPTLKSNPDNPSPNLDNKPHPRTLIVWGASSSIGSTALQLARASSISSQSSPLTLLAVASAHNFHYCKSLGASQVFDYHSRSIEAELLSAAENTTLAGIFHAAGSESAVRACAHIASRSEGKALVVTVRPPPQDNMPSDVRIQAIKSPDIFKPGNEVGSRIWRDFVPGALARGLLVPAPEAVVVGSGLRSIQKGLDVQKRGVSARKVVVEGIERDASKEDEGGWEVEKARRVRSELYV